MRLRWLGGAFFLLGVVLLNPDTVPGQPGRGPTGPGGGPGGFPGGGGPGGPGGVPGRGSGRGFDPEMQWQMLARVSGATGDTIDLAKVPADTKRWMRLPETGPLTKGQFVEQANARMRSFGGPGGGPGGFGGPPGFGGPGGMPAGPGGAYPTPGAPGAPNVTATAPGTQPMGPGMGGPPGFGGQPGFGGPPGVGGPGGQMDDQDTMRRFRERDRNQDGRISMDEASDMMRPRFAEFDRNRDGFVDFEEYKPYMATVRGGRGGPGGGPGGPPGFGGPPPGGDPNNANAYAPGAPGGGYGPGGDFRREEKKEEVPSVFAIRYGKLPQGLPEFWTELDTDKDGQVGLYEWRTGGRDMKEFIKMDLDGDGLLAPTEYLRYAQVDAEQKRLAAAAEGDGSEGPGRTGMSGRGNRGPGSGGPGAGPGTGPGGRGPGSNGPGSGSPGGRGPGGPGSKGGEKGGGGDNPFRGGGKGK